MCVGLCASAEDPHAVYFGRSKVFGCNGTGRRGPYIGEISFVQKNRIEDAGFLGKQEHQTMPGRNSVTWKSSSRMLCCILYKMHDMVEYIGIREYVVRSIKIKLRPSRWKKAKDYIEYIQGGAEFENSFLKIFPPLKKHINSKTEYQ